MFWEYGNDHAKHNGKQGAASTAVQQGVGPAEDQAEDQPFAGTPMSAEFEVVFWPFSQIEQGEKLGSLESPAESTLACHCQTID
jgi:hypothetical protein